MTIINLTPHAIHLPDQTVQPSGEVARIETYTPPAPDGAEVVFATVYTREVSGLPSREEGVLLLVSLPTALALTGSGRDDVVTVWGQIRDDNGRIVGAEGLARWVGGLPPENSVWLEGGQMWVRPECADVPNPATARETFPGAY